MNAAKSLARGLERSVSIIKSSRHICSRSLSTTWCAIKNRPLMAGSVNYVSKQAQVFQILRPMSSAAKFEVINVQDENDFKKRVLDSSSSVPVVVDFHATWCGPCKILGPRLESLLSKEDGKVLMAKVDIDENPELAMEYGVRSVPTVVGVKNGAIQGQFVGVLDDDQISSFIDKLVVS